MEPPAKAATFRSKGLPRARTTAIAGPQACTGVILRLRRQEMGQRGLQQLLAGAVAFDRQNVTPPIIRGPHGHRLGAVLDRRRWRWRADRWPGLVAPDQWRSRHIGVLLSPGPGFAFAGQQT